VHEAMLYTDCDGLIILGFYMYTPQMLTSFLLYLKPFLTLVGEGFWLDWLVNERKSPIGAMFICT